MPVKIEKDNSISISGFEGIGQSPLSDFSDMMGINTDRDGVASCEYDFNIIKQTPATQTFTADPDTDEITVSVSIRYRGTGQYRAFTVSSTGTLPAGLTAETVYYIADTSTAQKTKISTTLENVGDGVYINITSAGAGTHTITFIEPTDIKFWAGNYALDSNNNLWKDIKPNGYGALIAGNTSFGDGNGLIMYKGYAIIVANTKMDALKDFGSLPPSDPLGWENDFLSSAISVSGYNAMPYLSLNDDSIYFNNGVETGRYFKIGMLEEAVDKVFDPSDDTTFTLVVDVLTIPYEDDGAITGIRELGEDLIVSTNTGKIYFWDKKSPSFTSYIQLPENQIDRIEAVNNTGYAFIGNNGNIYAFNKTSSTLFNKIPKHLLGFDTEFGVDSFNFTFTIPKDNKIIFSTETLTTSATVKNNIWELDLVKNTIKGLSISSLGETSERNGPVYGKIHSIKISDNNNLIISSSTYDISDEAYTYYVEANEYKNSIEGGDELPTYFSNYEPRIITGLIPYGDVYNKKTLREIHISFMRALTTGQGIKLSYRRDDNSSWTLLKTVDFTTDGAVKDIKVVAPITDIIDIQFKIELDGYANKVGTVAMATTTPYLKLVRLIP